MLPNGRMLRLFFSSQRDNISCDELGQVSAPTLIVKGDRSIPFFQLTSDAVARCMLTWPSSSQLMLSRGLEKNRRSIRPLGSMGSRYA